MKRLLETVSLRKEYPGTVALDDVSVHFEGGKVSALLGKNGAGKSTLVKILAGTVQPTSGEIRINGEAVRLASASDAFRQGIATVYQELSLIHELTVAENILLGRMPRRAGSLGLVIDWPAACRRAGQVLAEMGVDLPVRAKVSQLGVAHQQVVEIAKAVSFDPSVILLDEPTSALAQHETEMLFRIVRRLADKGVAILYITHRLQELQKIVDSVTVLRDGRHVGTFEYRELTSERMVSMIFGETVQKQRPSELQAGAKTLMEVRGLSRKPRFRDVSFKLRRGEILGIAGMLGAGRTELLRAIFGADPFDAGEILLDGKPFRPASPRAANRRGIAMIPENRKEQSLILPLSVRRNICLASLRRVSWCGWITDAREQKVAVPLIDRLAIKLSSASQPVESLSGGNQQKIVVGKWLNALPQVVLFDEPTRGIDLQAKQQIFQIMWDLSRQGVSSLFVSSELEELLEVCHRILIMKSGEIREEVLPGQLTVDALVLRCMEAVAPLSKEAAA